MGAGDGDSEGEGVRIATLDRVVAKEFKSCAVGSGSGVVGAGTTPPG